MSSGSRAFNDFASNLNFINPKAASPSAHTAAPNQTAAGESTSNTMMGYIGKHIKLPTRQGATGLPVTTDDIGESQGLIGLAQKGIGSMASGAKSVATSARSVVSGAQQKVSDNMISTDRLIYFGISAALGIFFMALAFFFLPVMVIMPQKFAVPFTVGSLCCLASLCFLRGPKAFWEAAVAYKRLPFSLTYGLSLLLTFWASMVHKSYLFALVFSVTQCICLAALLLSNVPGGQRFLGLLGGMCLGAAKRAVCRWNTNTPLPL
ncbi:unnamed protein product [Vitrella brassicaformis CCMP3155]|uniref:Vesicle transport protein n=1 Tax=Vitrella brassicaformis (strain CCMP3155) TaxID=1169540 RepID=A0A0G4E9R1_VITBC|nr:unnamed protein product [Vitrella brassicaformis CCMP3155]|eukprot:CEL92656.1 unnamed protein product [Vitrella brassicaformis CCMP3155]